MDRDFRPGRWVVDGLIAVVGVLAILRFVGYGTTWTITDLVR